MASVHLILMLIFAMPYLILAFNNYRIQSNSKQTPAAGRLYAFETNDIMEFGESKVRLLLYTSNGDDGTVINSTSIKNTSFNTKYPVKFIIHGFRSTPDDSQLMNLLRQFQKYSQMNIIMVDWSELADTWDYPLAVLYSKKVAIIVGEFIVDLINGLNTDLSQVHVLGHSLGGQCAGFVGKYIISQTGNKLSRISGLDPAAPLFETPVLVDPSKRLTSDDAQFVDVIHVNRGIQGFSAPLGHADFYPNDGGPEQPGCGDIIDGNVCSHQRCIDYYAESINNDNFVSHKCSSWRKFRMGQCQHNATANLGYHVPSNSTGVFYLYTNSKSPFAINS